MGSDTVTLTDHVWHCAYSYFIGHTSLHVVWLSLCCALFRLGQIASGIYHPQCKWEFEGKSLWHTMHHLNVCWLSPVKMKQSWSQCSVPVQTHSFVSLGGVANVLCNWLMGRNVLWAECIVNLVLKFLSTVSLKHILCGNIYFCLG